MSSASMGTSVLAGNNGPELGEADLLAHVLEHDLDGHVAANVRGIGLDLDEVGVEARPFVQLDEGGDVGDFAAPGGVPDAVLNGERVDPAAAAYLPPLDVPAEAVGAEGAGVEVEAVAGEAIGEPQLVVAAALPVALCLRAGCRKRLGRLSGHRYAQA